MYTLALRSMRPLHWVEARVVSELTDQQWVESGKLTRLLMIQCDLRAESATAQHHSWVIVQQADVSVSRCKQSSRHCRHTDRQTDRDTNQSTTHASSTHTPRLLLIKAVIYGTNCLKNIKTVGSHSLFRKRLKQHYLELIWFVLF